MCHIHTEPSLKICRNNLASYMRRVLLQKLVLLPPEILSVFELFNRTLACQSEQKIFEKNVFITQFPKELKIIWVVKYMERMQRHSSNRV